MPRFHAWWMRMTISMSRRSFEVRTDIVGLLALAQRWPRRSQGASEPRSPGSPGLAHSERDPPQHTIPLRRYGNRKLSPLKGSCHPVRLPTSIRWTKSKALRMMSAAWQQHPFPARGTPNTLSRLLGALTFTRIRPQMHAEYAVE